MSGIFAYTASALTIICSLNFRVKVGCHIRGEENIKSDPYRALSDLASTAAFFMMSVIEMLRQLTLDNFCRANDKTRIRPDAGRSGVKSKRLL